MEEDLFLRETEAEWEANLTALEAESPFMHAFEQGQKNLIEPEEREEKFVGGDQWASMDNFSAVRAEAQAEERLADWEEDIGDFAEEHLVYAEQEDNLFLEDEGLLGKRAPR